MQIAANASGGVERMVRKAAAPARHFRRMLYSWLGSEMLPAFGRTWILQRTGARLHSSVCIWSSCIIRSNRLAMDEQVFINVGFFFDGAELLTIQRNVRIGQFVSVITATHEIGPPEQRCLITPVFGAVTIEEGCWIGTRVTIMPGVTIARGCVIGAGAVVFDNTEPNGLYGGTPARRLKDLPLDTYGLAMRDVA